MLSMTYGNDIALLVMYTPAGGFKLSYDDNIWGLRPRNQHQAQQSQFSFCHAHYPFGDLLASAFTSRSTYVGLISSLPSCMNQSF